MSAKKHDDNSNGNNESSGTRGTSISAIPLSLASFLDKTTYKYVSDEFRVFHKHTLNVALHLFTTGLGVWGAVQLAVQYDLNNRYDEGQDTTTTSSGYYWGGLLLVAYTTFVALTTPILTAVLHTAVMAIFVYLEPPASTQLPVMLLPMLPASVTTMSPTTLVCLAAIVLGYGLQDLAHYLCVEPTYMSSYRHSKPWMLVLHTLWLLPLVLEECSSNRHYWFVPLLLVPHKRFLVVPRVASIAAVDQLRAWLQQNLKETKETTHLWPHQHPFTSKAVTALEQDASILAAFRKLFAAQEYDIRPVTDMNEIYVTAVGSKQEINSDAVFYTPHVDGPYWWLPGISLYRVLVGITENEVVRTRFNLQHNDTCNHVLDLYGVLGFDYNRELHWIEHVPNKVNKERRSLVKLHFVVYPRGWKRYGELGARLNATYNTWARGNFLRTLRPKTTSELVLAWWIWLTTWTNAVFEEYFGWSNLVYLTGTYALARACHCPLIFVVLTSFRHYAMYCATFAFRDNAAHGFLMRDAKLYKTFSMLILARDLLPLVQWTHDWIALAVASCGFLLTLLATYRLGMVRTYFGTELGLVPPKYITSFPYGTIPHPMIVGQIFGLGVLLVSLYSRLQVEQVVLLAAHIGCYTVHMVQEILTSSY